MGAANKHYKMKKEESLEATLLALHLPEEKKRTLCGRRRTAEPKGGRSNCCWATLPLDLTNTTVAELSTRVDAGPEAAHPAYFWPK